MFKKKFYLLAPIFVHRIQRPGITLMAILICTSIFGLVISKSAGTFTSPGLTYAQASSSIFGVEANPFTPSYGANYITQTQTSWVRGPVVNWNDIETVEGTYNWSNLGDALAEVQLAVSNGIEPIVVVRGTPSWAQKHAGYTCGPIDAAKYTAFGDFLVELATSSPLASLNVRYWELWNEPDRSWQQVPSPAYIWAGCWGEISDTQYYGGGFYGEMLATVYPLIKAADPQAQVLIGGLMLDCDPNNPPEDPNNPGTLLDCTSAKFLEGILAGVGASSYDGISYHAYDYYGGVSGTYANTNWQTTWETGGPSLVKKGQHVSKLLQQYNISGKYLLNTENALLCSTCSNDAEFEKTKAYYVAEAYASAMGQDLMANIWFSVLGEWGRNNGLLDILTAGFPPLPAYDAYKFAAQELSGASYVGTVSSFPGIAGHEFSKSDRHIWLVWSPDGTNIQVDFLATPLNVYDVDGDAVPFTDARLTITREPYYVELPASLPRLHLPLTNMKSYASIPNGDFEDGQTGWTFTDNGLPASLVSIRPLDPTTGSLDTNIPFGTHAALLGDPNYPCVIPGIVPIGYAEIRRTITVPIQPNQGVWLDFNYILYSQDASTQAIYDRFEVFIQNASSTILGFSDGNMVANPVGCTNWRRVPGPENARNGKQTGWAQGSIDLSSYQGQSISIYFRNYSRYDNYYNTYTYLDNIRLR
jgi:hypothetical protein